MSPSPAARGCGQRTVPGTLLDWFAAEGEDLPWRRTRDRYAVLVSEVQLQATQVSRVVPYFTRWMARWPTAASLAEASLGDVLAAWHGLGYPRRAKRLHEAARVVARSGWPSPDRYTDLPGVGAYTAAALRCFADGEPVLPVDTNVARVLARRFPEGWPGTPPGQGWAAGQALMDLGRRVCTARGPACGRCPVQAGCPAADAGVVEAVTPRGRRQGAYEGSMRQRRGRLLGAVVRDGAVAVTQDPEAAGTLVAEGLLALRGDDLVAVP